RCRGEAVREDEAVQRIGKVGLRYRLDARRIRRVVADARATLRKDRLKDTSMRDAETTSDGEVTRAAGDSSEQMVLFPVRRVRESQTRIDVIARPVPVVDEVIAFLRRTDVLIARTDVQNEVVRRAPVVLRVEILLIEPVRQRGRPECLGERSHATGPKRGDRRS